MNTSEVERLNRTQPPSGYVVWFDDDWGCCCYSTGDDGRSFNVEPIESEDQAVAAAWAHYEREHDPPGLWTGFDGMCSCIEFVPRLGVAIPRIAMVELHAGRGRFGTREEAQVDARAAAWAWYWRRVDLAAEVEVETQVKLGEAWVDRRLLLGDVEVWPRCLAWSDEQVAAVERWLAEGGEPPEVLRA